MPPRRAARTHSNSKPLTFDGICEEATGVLGLKPWELWEYTFEEYLWHRKGYYAEQRRLLIAQYEHTRLQAYYAIIFDANLPYSLRKKSIDKLIPHAYNSKPEEPKTAEWFEKQREHARKVSEELKKKAGLKKSGNKPKYRR